MFDRPLIVAFTLTAIGWISLYFHMDASAWLTGAAVIYALAPHK